MIGSNRCDFCQPLQTEPKLVCTNQPMCPVAWTDKFANNDQCWTNARWYFSRYCAPGCSPFFGAEGCGPNPNATQGGISLRGQRCTGDCICRGHQSSGCYAKVSPMRAVEMVSGHFLCYGTSTFAISGPTAMISGVRSPMPESAVHIGLHRRARINENSIVDPSGASIRLVYDRSVGWTVQLLLTDAGGAACYSETISNDVDLMDINDFSIGWFPDRIDFLMGSMLLGSANATAACIPQPPLWATIRIVQLEAGGMPRDFFATLNGFAYTPGNGTEGTPLFVSPMQ